MQTANAASKASSQAAAARRPALKAAQSGDWGISATLQLL
jgi:hypothetical protein